MPHTGIELSFSFLIQTAINPLRSVSQANVLQTVHVLNGAFLMQVLLSQVHRLRALWLLGNFLDMGPWAVDLALSVGIYPYVLKLLQTTATDLRETLIFIWTKILALDRSCQVQSLSCQPRHC